MRKLIFGILMLFVFNSHVSAQLYKGQWMAGGNLGITTYDNYMFPHNGLSGTVIPNIGYFFVDKLVGGLRFDVNWGETKFSSSFTTYGFSPFLRYYILPAEKKINFFVNTSFGWQIASLGGGFTQWTLSAGPSLFIASNFSIELALQYAAYSPDLYTEYHPRSFAINIGFQFHFGSDR
jgi:hypothetical protein